MKKNDTMSKDGMKKESTETKGMSNGSVSKDNMKRDMSKDGSPASDPSAKKDGGTK